MCAILYAINFSLLSLKWTWLCKEKRFHPSSCCMLLQREACWEQCVIYWSLPAWELQLEPPHEQLPEARMWMINIYLANWLVKPLRTSWNTARWWRNGNVIDCKGWVFSVGWLQKGWRSRSCLEEGKVLQFEVTRVLHWLSCNLFPVLFRLLLVTFRLGETIQLYLV